MIFNMVNSKTKILHFFIYTNISLMCFSCFNNKKLNIENTLILKENVSMPIDNNINFKSWQIHVTTQNDTTYLLRKNYFNNSIVIYNWTNKEKHKQFIYDIDGPNKVSKFESAAFLQLKDDEFLIANAYSQIYIVNNDSVIFKNHFANKNIGVSNVMNGFNKNLPIRVNDEVYIYRKPFNTRFDKGYYSNYLLVKFNLKSKELNECQVKLPNTYIEGECWGFEFLRPSFTLNNKNQLIYSFPIDDNLYSYSLTDNLLKKIPKNTKSSFKISMTPLKKCEDPEPDEYYYHVKKSARYESISYDKYRDVYYRILLLPPKDLSKQNVHSKDMRVVIIVLDNEFNILTEKILPDDVYDYDDFFITSEGFWLSRNNRNNPDFDENFMNFDLFILNHI